MPISPSWQTVIADVASQGINYGLNQWQNNQNRHFAYDNMMIQRGWSTADWDRANAYNHPTQQMQRLKEAGLNPRLIYDNGPGSLNAQPIRNSDSAKWEGRPSQVDLGGSMMKYMNAESVQAQTDNVRKNTELTEANTQLTKLKQLNEILQPELTRANIGKISQDTAAGAFHLGQDKVLAPFVLEAKKAMVDNLKKDLEVKSFGMTMQEKEYTLHALQTTANIREAGERILRSMLSRQIDTEMLPYTKRHQEGLIQQAMSSAHLNAFEYDMRKKGLTNSDPWYIRGFFQVMDKAKERLQSLLNSK